MSKPEQPSDRDDRGRPFRGVAFVNTLSPERSLSEMTLLVNTITPAESVSPEVRFGHATINSLSPAESLSPITVALHDAEGGKVTVDADALSVGTPFTARGSEKAQLDRAVDLLMVSRVLTPEELLATDAQHLLKIKRRIYQELVSSPEVAKLLRERVADLLP